MLNIARDGHISAAAEVHSIDLKFMRNQGQSLVFEVVDAVGPLEPDVHTRCPKKENEGADDEADDAASTSSGSREEDIDVTRADSDSDYPSCASSEESGVETEREEPLDDTVEPEESEEEREPEEEEEEEEEEHDVPEPPPDPEESPDEMEYRADPGAHIVEKNGYFSFQDNPDHPDVKVYMHKNVAAAFGNKNKSKTVRPRKFDGTKDTCWLLLRAWMIGRVAEGDWLEAKHSRFVWWSAELDRLQDLLRRRGHPNGGTGNADADDLIRVWCPIAFAR